MIEEERLTIKQASQWASQYTKKNITPSNISYLIQYGKIRKWGKSGRITVIKCDLIDYYKNFSKSREIAWKAALGDDLNWHLSFDSLKESDTTKHVHRLHPYKGKFIPQLVEYFIDEHTDEFKTATYFKKGDIILDPFSGSGTTMVQANEQGVHAIGIDISAFNALIANVKVRCVDFSMLENEINQLTIKLERFISENCNTVFQKELLEELNVFNKVYFPSPEFKIKVSRREIDEKDYARKKEKEFVAKFEKMRKKHELKILQSSSNSFLEKWYLDPVRKEIDFMLEQIKVISASPIKEILIVILSRVMRSCRATTHADLATLKEPISKPYYCRKHGKICKPLFSIYSWWKRYCSDTVKRLYEFDRLKTDTYQYCLQGDARTIDIPLKLSQHPLSQLFHQQKIKGIFSSPPYVGLIDYHEQHAYAYDLFGFDRYDALEIGPLFKGQGKEARNSYIEGIANVLNNSKQYLQKDYDVFLVANDKYNMYPMIAQKAGMRITNRYRRPVLNRTEKDKSAYAEIIFHLKQD